MKKRRICIIYTGGTIGMVPSERGYIPSSGAFRRLLRAIPDLYWDAMPEWDVVEFDPLLDSSDVAVREWNQMGRAIAERYDDYDGFVVLHGTDTMAYSASALAFMLENLAKPVIFTGAQIPLGQPIHFVACSLEDALKARADRQRYLEQLAWRLHDDD